ncbi:MAG: pyruvate:ferredoxin (flavodoxin) oxidoreductase [Lachnospiraceae bacterium]|nr:pyruvate:ferredoxin (flavodoxin) oxidoreductase [Lachnospiraceae bacterium]
MTIDGNGAAAHVAYEFTEIAAIYPITPSSPMAGSTDQWSANGRKNMFDQRVRLIEMQSEAGAIGAVHGALQAGALATSYTSSQGLMLMVPVLYRIAGERLPAVLHVASRTVGTHALSIFGDHSDVMACRQTGFAQLSSGSVQEAADLAAIAHLSAVRGSIPFMHFFDGFRTSHELSRIDMPDVKELSKLMDQEALDRFRAHALNPEHPLLRATVQNGDVYFQVREAHNPFYDALPDIVQEYMDREAEITGRHYHLFDYYGDPEATDVVIAMGSVSGAAREAVDYMNAQAAAEEAAAKANGSTAGKERRRYGYLQVHLYRPFSVKHFIDELPEGVKRIAVLDRCKEMGSIGEPLYLDVAAAVSEMERERAAADAAGNADGSEDAYTDASRILVIGGRYGLSSKDTDPAQIVAVFNNLASEEPVRSFTIGIEDDVTHLSLPVPKIDAIGDSSADSDIYSCKFWGLGGDGTVGANHNTVQILGDCADMYAQAYFEYDAKKSFGITKSHLRLSKKPIISSYYVKHADFVACHNQSYMSQYDIVDEIKPGGSFLLNCIWGNDAESVGAHLPDRVKRQLHDRGIHLYVINATAIAEELGLGSHTNTVLQAAFFKVSDLMPVEEALENMKEAARRTYFRKGDAVVAQNVAAIEAGAEKVYEIPIPEAWGAVEPDTYEIDPSLPDVVKNILIPINRQKGDDLPVSAFEGREDGAIEMGLTAYEKRGIAVNVPVWDADKCIQCNQCAYVCPHAAIRPYLVDEAEAAAAPEGFVTVPAKGLPKTTAVSTAAAVTAPGASGSAGAGQAAAVASQDDTPKYRFTMQISAYDCTGCGSCANVCPVKDKALKMMPAQPGEQQKATWEYGLSLSDKGDVFNPYTVKGSQFRQPLVEFSAACAGCAETSYAKLLTQLFGDKVYWANATGCSQAWGSPMPGIPYTTNKRGFGPAWTNSLFENNAELELGLYLSVQQQRDAQKMRVEKLVAMLEADRAKAAETPDTPDAETAPDAFAASGRAEVSAAVEDSDVLTACRNWLDTYNDLDGSRKATDALVAALTAAVSSEDKGISPDLMMQILKYKDQLAKKTFWMFGGDGWAYDIGFGGLDHVIAQGENINVLVIDTEVYSNTGGQSSKATPIGAVAQFASSGKKSRKKDLGAIMMTYGNVYVAQVAMGADMNQLIRVLKEAEEYDGPSVVIAYCPCVSHGIKGGMSKVQDEMKRAVQSGYWNLYHYDPRDEHPMHVDSKAPSMAFSEFLDGEARYASLKRTFPDNAEKLFAIGEAEAAKRYEKYKKMEE